jgi:[acyl-carrier-protein] S-malonyltransferase
VTTVAYLFGGQGTETARMSGPPELVEHAGRAAGVDAVRLLARGGPELQRTSVLQPLLTAVGLGVCRALASAGLRPSFVAGHSLGELAAWSAAGGLRPEDAIDLAAVRGRLMERAAARRPGGMLALHRCDRGQLRAALRRARPHGALVVAAHNAPGEWVVSGDERALAAVAAHHPSSRVPVRGAWHSPAMAACVEELCAAARALPRSPCRARLIVNRTGRVVDRDEDLPELLGAAPARPVRWAVTMATLRASDVTHIVTVGPGKLLRSLARQNLGDGVRLLGTETAADLAATLAELRP